MAGFYKNIGADIKDFPWDFNTEDDSRSGVVMLEPETPYAITDEMKKNITCVDDNTVNHGKLHRRFDDIRYIKAIQKDRLAELTKHNLVTVQCDYCIFTGTWACAWMSCTAEENIGAYVNALDECVNYRNN